MSNEPKKKMTTGDLFGGLFKRGVRNIRLTDDVPKELHDLLGAVQEAMPDVDEDDSEVITVEAEVVTEEPA